MVQVFRRSKSISGTESLRLKGLKVDHHYIIEDLDNGRTREIRGSDPAQCGLEVTLTHAPGFTVLLYKINGRPGDTVGLTCK